MVPSWEVAITLWWEVMVWLGPCLRERNLQKVSPPRPLFQRRELLLQLARILGDWLELAQARESTAR